MITRLLLTGDDVLGMLAAVLSYNRRGQPLGLTFHGEDRAALPVAYVEVYVEEPGLAVRAAPEPDPEEVRRAVNPPVADPTQVPAPASLEELKRLLDDA